MELTEKDGKPFLDTNVCAMVGAYRAGLVTSDVLGKAFEPEERFENSDGTGIVFDSDYFGSHRGLRIMPGPFADGDPILPLWS